jgi:hypothetical protein
MPSMASGGLSKYKQESRLTSYHDLDALTGLLLVDTYNSVISWPQLLSPLTRTPPSSSPSVRRPTMSATSSPLDLLCAVASHQEKLPSPHSETHSQSPLADSATLLSTPQIIPDTRASSMDHDNEDKDGSSSLYQLSGLPRRLLTSIASPTDLPTPKARRRPSKAKLARSPSGRFPQ